MHKIHFLIGLLLFSIYACQKPDTGQFSQETPKVSQSPGNELSLDAQECSSCEWFLEVVPSTKGEYAVTLETQPCEDERWWDPITIFGSVIDGDFVTIGHDRRCRVAIHNSIGTDRIFTCNLYSTTSADDIITTGKVTVPAFTTVLAVFKGRVYCGCDWRYNCSEK